MKIAIIVAMASNRVIGLNKQMPWHLPADLKRFKQITMGAPILMGRNTHESIGKPLPGRTNIVISRNPDFKAPGCLVFNDMDTAITKACEEAEEAFIIGGSALYKSFLPLAHTLYLTKINKAFSGDTEFPEWQDGTWQEVERADVDDDVAAGFSYSFLKYVRHARKN